MDQRPRLLMVGGVEPAWRPLVLGPDGILRVTDEADARKAAELSVLSVIAHAAEPDGPSIALAALLGLQGVDDKTRPILYDLLMASVGEAIRKELQAVVQSRPRDAKRSSTTCASWDRR